MLSNPCQWGCRMPWRREWRTPWHSSPDCRGEPCIFFIRSVLEAVSVVPARLPPGCCPLSTQGCHSCHFPPVRVTLMPFTAVFDLWDGQKTRDGKAVCKHKAWTFAGPVEKGCVFKCWFTKLLSSRLNHLRVQVQNGKHSIKSCQANSSS